MLNACELKLLTSNAKDFPMIRAASAALKNCTKCGHGNINVKAILNTAVTMYRTNPAFIEHCKKLFKLPCVIGDLVVKEL